ncbi:MAG: Urease accessory protein UreF [Labilithrix sp.]|nr:Urease accessory protein UreF [Labilithrix sp.]
MTSWLFLQLVDGGFPSGGFAHSQGLEAALHLRGLREIDGYLDEALWQAGRASLPFVRRACEQRGEGAALAQLDALFDASCTSHVASRASRAQGRSLASTCGRIYDDPAVQAIADHARHGPAHHAPVFGAVLGALGIDPADAVTGYLHGCARGLLSAGVRLGLLGPLEAQRLLAERRGLLERIALAARDVVPEESAQASPVAELFGALHDRLDGRLFQS